MGVATRNAPRATLGTAVGAAVGTTTVNVTIEQVLAAYVMTASTVEGAMSELRSVADRLRLLERTVAHPGQIRLAETQSALAQAARSVHQARMAVTDLTDVFPQNGEIAKLRPRVQQMMIEVQELRVRVGELADRPRPTARRLRLSAVSDVPGKDLRPDPLDAGSTQEFMTALRRYRQWAGDIPFRVMAQRAGIEAASASTMCTTLKKDTLPRLDIVMAIIIGCGGGEEDRARFATAWRTLRLPSATPSVQHG